MSAIVDILQLRGPLEESVRTSFVAAGYAAVTRQNFPQSFQQARPRFEIKALIGAATGHRIQCPDNIVRFDRWRFTLNVQVVTNTSGTDATTHEAHVGYARAFLMTLAQVSWTDTTNFPNTLIAEPLRETGSSSYLKAEDGVEYTTLNYAGVVSVRETAWPT